MPFLVFAHRSKEKSVFSTRARLGLVAAMAAVAAAAGCTSAGTGTVTPTSRPTAPPTARPSPTGPADFIINDVSVVKVLRAATPVFNLNGAYELVPNGKLSGACIGNGVMQGDRLEQITIRVCPVNPRVVVAQALEVQLKGTPPVVVWYVFGYNIVRAERTFLSEPSRICAGAYFARLSPQYNSSSLANLEAFAVSGKALKAFVTSNPPPDQEVADAFIQAGFQAAEAHKSVGTCAKEQ